MVPRIYSQNYAVRLSAQMPFLSKLRHLKKLTALVAFVSIFSFQGFSQCPLPISVECESDAVAMAVAAVSGCTGVTTGSYLVGSEPTLPVCSISPQSVIVRVIHDGTCDASGFCDVVVNITGDATAPMFAAAPADVTVETLSLVPTMTNLAWTDNCNGASGSETGTDGALIGGACGGTIIRTWSVTDPCGNTGTASQTITVDDTTNPVAVCPATIADVVLDASGNGILPANIGGGLSADNSGTVTETSPSASFTCADVGVQMVTLTATDACGNINTTTCSFNVVDNTNPVAVCPAAITDVMLDASGNGTLPANIGDGSSTDNCAGVVETSPAASFTCADVGIQTVVLTATDASGNTNTTICSFNVVDNIDPVAVCPAAIGDVVLDASGNGTLPANIGDGSSTDNCAGIIETSPSVSLTCADVGVQTVVLTATDASGNTNTTTCSFNVVDNINPVLTCLADITIFTDPGTCEGTATIINPTASDNCSVGMVTNNSGFQTSATDASGVYPVGTTTVEFTTTDPSGNTGTCSIDVNVVPNANDMNPGDMAVDNDLGDCSAVVSWPSIAENCPGALTVTYDAINIKGNAVTIFTSSSGGSIVDFGTFPVGVTTVSYTIEDLFGNSDMGNFDVTVFDDEAPNVLYPSGVVLNYANCNSDAVVPNYGFLTDVDDNCTGYTITQSPAPGTLVSDIATLASGETFTVTITVTDNSPSATNMGDSDDFVVTLNEDNTPVPNLSGAVLDPISGSCGPLVVDAPYAVDACGNTICGVPFPLPAGTIDLGPVCGAGGGGGGACSNISKDIPLVNIPDSSPGGVNIPIVFTESGIVESIELDLNINHTWVGDLIVTLTDPDGNSIEIFNRPGVPAGFFGCAGNDLDVTFTNSGALASVFETTCNNAPAISGSFQPLDPFSIITDANVNAQGTWILNISDNAGGDTGSTVAGGSLSLCIQNNNSTATPDYLFPVGTHNITWNYDGGNGNIVTQQQVITVADDSQGPDMSCQDITIALDAGGNASIVSDELVQADGFYITMTEDFGNNANNEGQAMMSITATINTTFSFDWDYNNSDPGFEALTYFIDGAPLPFGNILSDGSADLTGSTSIPLTTGQVLTIALLTTDNLFGEFSEVTITSSDFTGDFSLDNWVFDSFGVLDATLDIIDGTVTDNCSDPGNIVLSISQSSFDCSDLGANTVTLTATDEAGNSSQCTATVTVVDLTAPVLSNIPMNVTVDCNAIPSPPTIGTGVGQIDATDACGTLGVIFNQTSTQLTNSSLCGFYNYQITRTWSVSDASGNLTEESQVITVQDDQGLIFATTNFPSTISANAAAGSCNAFVSLEMTDADVLDLPGCVNFADFTITNNGTGTGDADASGIYPVGSTPVTFTVTDPCGNSDSYTVNVNVSDNTPPIAACNNITVSIPDGQDSIIIDATLISLIDNGSFDNCSPTVQLDIFPNVFYCSQIADGTQDEFDITLAVSVPGSTDTTFCETTIIIQDNNAPNITCIDPVVITLGADGTATATTTMLNGGIDDCSDIMTIELIGNTGFDINDIGSHPISDGITPTLQVTDIHGNVETCTPTNLIVTPPTTCLTSVDVISNGQVAIPYTSTNFTNVVGFQFSMQVDDETVATFAQDAAANLCGAVTINVPNLSGINQSLICNGNFTNQISADGKVLSVSWFNSTPNPVSIPDGVTLFNFRLNALGVVGEITTFSITGTPYSNELTTKYGNDILTDNPPLCIDPIGTFEVGNNATLPISGNVSTWSRTRIDTIGYDTISVMPLVTNPILDTVVLIAGQGLANASMVKIETMLPSGTPVTTDTDITDSNGDYTLQVANVANGVSINLTPRKNNPNWLNNGDVSSSDLFFIQQHIVNNIPFTSIYDYIASDVNQSGTITTLDLVLIQDVIVNPELSPIPSSVIDAYNPWRFIQREYAEMNLDPFDLDLTIALPSQPMAPVIPANAQDRFYNPAILPMTDVDWIAVKVGQVFGNLNTSTLTTNDVDSRTGENFVMSVENQKVTNGELISIPVYAKDYAAFIAWQFTLEFDENYLAYEGMIPGAITGFEENKLGLNAVEEGIIGALWYGTPNAVKSDEVLFTLQFTALDDADALSGLIDVTSRTVKSESSLMSGATGEVSLSFFSPTVTAATDFELHQNRPNPFNEETLISFNLPEAGFARVTISDISGRTLKVIEGDFAKGYNEVRIQSNHLSSTGVLYYQLESAEHIATKKMIILE